MFRFCSHKECFRVGSADTGLRLAKQRYGNSIKVLP